MSHIQAETPHFYGLDGDRIESVIEAHLIKGEIDILSCFSAKLTSTLEEIKEKVISEGGEIKYCAGDNILFLGHFCDNWCKELITLFYDRTGCTASIGIGETGLEFYLALKLAKARGGGQVIHYGNLFSHQERLTSALSESERRPLPVSP